MTNLNSTGSESKIPVSGIPLPTFRVNTNIFFLIIFVFQVLLTIQGLDLVDEGFHASLYQQFFNHPESVQYGFIYWLSGFVGGGIMKLFPFLGLWGIRVAGALISTLTLVLAYNIFKKHLQENVLKIGLVILVLFINNDPKNLYYNNLSAFLYLLVCYFMYNGLTNRKNLFIFLSGLVVGLNIFTRVPNILGIAIGLAIFYYGFIQKESFRDQATKFLLYGFGVILSVGLVFLLINLLGQWPVLFNAVKGIFTISAKATKNDGTEGSYGIINLATLCVKQYISAGLVVLLLVFLSFCWSYIAERIKQLPEFIQIGIKTVLLIPPAIFAILIIRNGINNYKMISFLSGLSLIATLIVMLFDQSRERKLIAFFGCFILLVHPLGSAVGIFTVAPYSLWLAFPFAVNFLMNTESLSINIRLKNKVAILNYLVGLNDGLLNRIRIIVFSVIIMTCLYQIIKYPYYHDIHSRLEMTHAVHNKFMKGIYTTAERAGVINELLDESSKFIKPNDYVLAYDVIPMYHYWTETKSYVRNPCPWFYSSTVFGSELALAETNAGIPLPVVVMQTVKMDGFQDSRWPEIVGSDDYALYERNKGRNKILNEFLERHHYKTVWSNKIFKILLPG